MSLTLFETSGRPPIASLSVDLAELGYVEEAPIGVVVEAIQVSALPALELVVDDDGRLEVDLWRLDEKELSEEAIIDLYSKPVVRPTSSS